LRIAGIESHQGDAPVLTRSVDAQNQHAAIRISVAGLDEFEENTACALGMHKDVPMSAGAGLDFV